MLKSIRYIILMNIMKNKNSMFLTYFAIYLVIGVAFRAEIISDFNLWNVPSELYEILWIGNKNRKKGRVYYMPGCG